MTAEQARRTKKERSAESSRRMLAAAISLIAEKGFENTTAVEIGERAGYSRELVRRRYGSKEALLESLLETEYKARLLTAEPDNSKGVRGIDRVLRLADQLLRQAREDPELLRAFFILCFEAPGPVQVIKPWMNNWLASYQQATASAIRAGQTDGSVRPDVDPDAEARSFMADGMGRAYVWVLGTPDTDFTSDLTEWRDRFHRLLAPPG